MVLSPCYVNGNTSNTILYRYRGAIPAEAAADARPDSGTGSRLFENRDQHIDVALRKNVSTGGFRSRRGGHAEAACSEIQGAAAQEDCHHSAAA